MLVENHLYAVVSLPAGVFNPYSGVKTSILLMDKEVAKNREEILFIKIDNDGYNLGAQRTAVKGGQLEEAIKLANKFVDTGEFEETTIAHLVPKAEIAKNGDFNLSGEKYKSIGILSTKYESVKLGEVCRVINGRAYKQDELLEKGKYPVMRVGNFFSNRSWYYSDLELDEDKYCENGDLLYAWSASFGPKIWNGEKCIYHYHIWKMVPDEERINKHFLYHVLNRETESIKAEGGRGIAMIHITKGGIEAREIPLPPLSIQEEIVAEIEGYQKIIDGAKAVVKNYKPKIDIDPDWEMVELGGLAKNLDGKRVPITKGVRDEGKYPYYGASGIVDFVANFIFDEDLLLISEDGANLLARVTPIAFSVSGKVWVNNHAHVLRFDKMVTQKFVEYYLNSISLEPYITGSAQPKLNQKALNSITIPLPDIETQHQIVAQIEKEQELVNANKQLIEIFVQKIKDRIAKVWGSSTTTNSSSERNEVKPYGEKEEVELGMVAEPFK